MDEKKVREEIELIRMEINTLEGIENCGRMILYTHLKNHQKVF